MHTPTLKGFLAFTSLCVVFLVASACASKRHCNVCNAETVGNVCRESCPDGPYNLQCIDEGGTYKCGSPAPCDENQHCLRECYDNKSCSFSKCSFSKPERNEGLYTCSDTACCLYSVYSEAGSDCTDGSCDGTGNCIPTGPGD